MERRDGLSVSLYTNDKYREKKSKVPVGYKQDITPGAFHHSDSVALSNARLD